MSNVKANMEKPRRDKYRRIPRDVICFDFGKIYHVSGRQEDTRVMWRLV